MAESLNGEQLSTVNIWLLTTEDINSVYVTGFAIYGDFSMEIYMLRMRGKPIDSVLSTI